jgi:hypothetical protein
VAGAGAIVRLAVAEGSSVAVSEGRAGVMAVGSAARRLGAAQADSKIKTKHNTPLKALGYRQCISIFFIP